MAKNIKLQESRGAIPSRRSLAERRRLRFWAISAPLRGVKPPERTRSEIGDGAEEDAAPPPLAALGRAVAIAKSGALGTESSATILLLAGSAQRRRPVAAINDMDLTDHGDEIEWAMRPYFRKSARNKRSSSRHRVPLVGFAAAAARDLKRATNGAWLCVPKTPSVLISRRNRLTSTHHDRANVFRPGRFGGAIQVEEPA